MSKAKGVSGICGRNANNITTKGVMLLTIQDMIGKIDAQIKKLDKEEQQRLDQLTLPDNAKKDIVDKLQYNDKT